MLKINGLAVSVKGVSRLPALAWRGFPALQITKNLHVKHFKKSIAGQFFFSFFLVNICSVNQPGLRPQTSGI